MESFIKADVFFFVTTLSVAFVAVLFIIALAYLIVILSRIKRVVNLLEQESTLWLSNIKKMRELSETFGGKIFSFISAFIARKVVGTKRRKPAQKTENTNN